MDFNQIVDIVEECKLLDSEIYLIVRPEKSGRNYIQAEADLKDAKTGKIETMRGSKFYISDYACKQEVVRTCYKAYKGFILHELQEKFMYRGKAIYGPHIDPDALWEVADKIQVRKDSNSVT